METIKINFGHFWPSFDNHDNYYTRILSKHFKVEISENPDFYFFTHPYNGKRDYLRYKCHRVFLGFENQRVDWNICDYALNSDFSENNPRHKRWPIWATYHPEDLTNPKPIDAFIKKKNFCCIVVSNDKAKERIEFYNRLSKYKKVDSGGRFMNNIGKSVLNKMDFIKDYKFVISFENSSYPGYTTEKLVEPMFVNSIPIYWGNPMVDEDFNTRSFINIHDTNSFDQAIETIIELDQDNEKYLKMAAEPWFHNNQVPAEMTTESLSKFFQYMVQDSNTKKNRAEFRIKNISYKTELLKHRVIEFFKARF